MHASEDNDGLTGQQLRKMWRAHDVAHRAAFDAWVKAGYQPSPPEFPVFPEVLRGLACGAKTRAGTPCKLTSIYSNGRCKLHGGLSTGPISQEGRAKASRNGHAAKQKRTP